MAPFKGIKKVWSLNLPSSFSTSIQFEHKQDHKEPQNHRPQSMSKPTVLASIGLGGGAAVITCNFTHPIELVKTRMQSKCFPRRSNLTSTFVVHHELPLTLLSCHSSLPCFSFQHYNCSTFSERHGCASHSLQPPQKLLISDFLRLIQ